MPSKHFFRSPKPDVAQLTTDLDSSALSSSPSTSPVLESSSSLSGGRAISFASGTSGDATSPGLGLDIPRSDTISSTFSSTSSGGDSEKKHRRALSFGRTKTGHHHSHAEPPAFHLPKHLTPVSLVECAISTLFSVPGYPLDELRNEILPQLYHEAYSHRVNCRETNLDGLMKSVESLRTRMHAIRIRFKSHLIDMDGTATMEAAAVGLQYDIIGIPINPKGKYKNEAEHERRGSAMCVAKIFEGRMAQADIVLDTAQFHELESPMEVACTVM
ncbi:hypothetical protein BCR35DRAFT_277127 [Leucosporidium creatinivorum]|uniref:Uncharacterized protein n=1 Tax=Leucosporidium creatinivorum TaxID=106004 RepID=A0A1Y2FZN3_9BASI|nr:hypothetical protein BCR35DRAFT_277127 [Leucosporidium creatinivorum]